MRAGLKCNKKSGGCKDSLKYLSGELEDYLSKHPEYNPIDDVIRYDDTVWGTSNMANNHTFGELRQLYWAGRIQAASVSDSPYALFTYYDLHSNAVLNANKKSIDWQSVKIDSLGLVTSFIGLNTNQKMKPLTDTITLVGGGNSLGHSISSGDSDSIVLSIGGVIPGPVGTIFSAGSVIKDLFPGYTYTPYVPSIPRMP
jgi:hypothetical protein